MRSLTFHFQLTTTFLNHVFQLFYTCVYQWQHTRCGHEEPTAGDWSKLRNEELYDSKISHITRMMRWASHVECTRTTDGNTSLREHRHIWKALRQCQRAEWIHLAREQWRTRILAYMSGLEVKMQQICCTAHEQVAAAVRGAATRCRDAHKMATGPAVERVLHAVF